LHGGAPLPVPASQRECRVGVAKARGPGPGFPWAERWHRSTESLSDRLKAGAAALLTTEIGPW